MPFGEYYIASSPSGCKGCRWGRMFKHFCCLFVCAFMAISVLYAPKVYGQYVINGTAPASTRWMQVKGDTYKVVYPQGADSLAKRYLWLLEQNSRAVMLGLGEIKPSKIPVVLYNQTANSNGMVVWAPKRMELFTLPMHRSYPIKWDEQLALHEMRHVGQMTHFTKGVWGVLEYLLGQQSPSIGVGLYGSRWLLEGDAVVAETELTNAGRGRNAEFMEYYRASFLEGKMRNWDKWKHGSYKYYTPNIYTMGYLINSTVRYRSCNYGYAGEIFDTYVKRFYNPAIVDFAFKKKVGATPNDFFTQGQEMMASIWQQELALRGNITEPEEVLQKRERGYQEYMSPVQVGKDSLLYIKYSYNSPVRLVLVQGGKEEVLRSFSSSAKEFRCSGDYIYFTENVPSSRWSNAVYGRAFSYNWRKGLQGGEPVKKLSGRTYFKTLYPSEDGETLLVGEFFPQGGSGLAVLDSRSGEVLRRIGAPMGGEIWEGLFLGGSIYALAVTDRGLGLFVLGEDDEWIRVIGEQAASIYSMRSGRVPAGFVGLPGNGDVEVLYFVSDVDGVRNIYVLEPERGILKRVTNSKYGAGEPYIADGVLYYSSLELGGKFPVKVSLANIGESGSEYEPVLEDGELVGLYRYQVADELSAQARRALGEKGMLASQEVIDERNGTSMVNYKMSEEAFAASVPVEKYTKFGHLFRFHSWAPLYYNVDRIMEFDFDKLHQVVSLGATAYSQNTLGTAVTMLGYSYHKGLHAGHFKFKYSGWYPVLQFSADVNASERYNIRIVRDSLGSRQVVENAPGALVEFKGLAYIPFKFNSHGWQRGLVPQVGVEYNNTGYFNAPSQEYLHSSSITSALQFYVMRDISHSGIYPQWGIGGVAKLKYALDGGENFGNASSLHLYGYLPGFAATHGIKLAASVQHQNVAGKNYYLGNLVNMPRGYKESFYGSDYLMGCADYAFPIYLGDVSVWKLAYLKRMQVIPFADYAVVKGYSGEGTVAPGNLRLSSCGASFLVDIAPFLWGVQCSVGVRYSYNSSNLNVPGTGNAFHVLFSTSL